jgi:hypothetical protein
MSQAPPGGPADTTAPAIVGATPASGTVNFHEKSIAVEFSEYVQESGVSQAVVITPIPAKPPEFDWSGTTLEIEFQEPLAPDRTYTITFGAGITDLSNNRLGHPFTIRFATGERIDSGRIQGTVLGKTSGRAFIFAYLLPADTAGFAASFHPDSVRPDFIAPVADDGGYSLEGLPTGTFRLFAVVDEFGDQLYSPGQDAYGLATGDVRVTSQEVPVAGVAIRLRSAPDDLTAPSLYSATSLSTRRTEVRLSEPVDSAGLRPANFSIRAGGVDAPITEVARTLSNRLAIQLVHGELPPGAEATVHATGLRDTAGNALPDSAATITFTVIAGRDSIVPTLLPLPLDSVRAYAFPDSIMLAFDEPVRGDSLAEAVSIRDTAGPRARFALRRLSPNEFVARPLDTLFGAARGVLEINLRRFPDEAGNVRDSTTKIVVALAQGRQNGSLQGTLTDSAAPNARHVVVARATQGTQVFTRTVLRSGPWEFAAIPEGEYEVSAYRDSDADGQYDYGSVVPYRPAEAYVIWRGTIRVRPRWATNKIDLVITNR